jgi:hypothetical protein
MGSCRAAAQIRGLQRFARQKAGRSPLHCDSSRSGERQRVEADLTTWRGNRATAGKDPPHGFPRSNRFT